MIEYDTRQGMFIDEAHWQRVVRSACSVCARRNLTRTMSDIERANQAWQVAADRLRADPNPTNAGRVMLANSAYLAACAELLAADRARRQETADAIDEIWRSTPAPPKRKRWS